MLPNFLVIGARRAGTTWLHQNLSQHPQVFMPIPKELHFFDRQFEKGIEYYASFFEGAAGQEAVGEATPAYLHTPEVCGRIHQNLPDTRLIVILRNPVDRLYSDFAKGAAKGRRKGDLSGFEEMIHTKSSVHEVGFYVDHLRRYLEYFPKEQILVLFFEELTDSADDLWRRLVDFLDIDPGFVPASVAERVNAASGKKYLAKYKSLYYGQALFKRLGLWKLARTVEKYNRTTLPGVSPEARKWLIENVYGEKNRELGKLLGVDLGHWNTV